MSHVARRALVTTAVVGSATAAFASFLAEAEAARDGSFYVIAELVAKPGQEDTLRNVLVPFVAGARKEPGCIHYSLLEDIRQRGRFLTFETWTNEAALNAHMVTPEIKAAGAILTTILEKPFTQIKLSMVTDG